MLQCVAWSAINNIIVRVYVCSMCMCKCIQYVHVCVHPYVYVSLPPVDVVGGGTYMHTYIHVCKYIHYIHCSGLGHWDVLLGPIRKSMGASAGDRGNMPFLFRKLDMYHRRAGRVKCFKR